jgi:16S rRNA processing protein RimM
LGGEVQVEVLTDFPERFASLGTVYVGEKNLAMAVEGQRRQQDRVLLKLTGINDRDEAGKLRGQLIQIPVEEAMPLEDEVFYVYEIVGLEVWTTEGEHLGHLAEVIETGSNDVYVVRGEEREILIPALSDAILNVDLEHGRIEVALMKGLR